MGEMVFVVMFLACFDLKTTWSLLGMSVAALTDYNDSTCFCPWCDVCNHAASKGKLTPRAHTARTMADYPASLIAFLPLHLIFFCCLHAKMRVTEMLLRRLGEEAEERGRFAEWVAAVAKVTHFWAKLEKNGKGVKVPMVMGNRVEHILAEVIFAAGADSQGAFIAFVQAVWTLPGRVFDRAVLSDTERAKYDNTIKLWQAWQLINLAFHQAVWTAAELAVLRRTLADFGAKYKTLYTAERVFPYLHVLCCHLVEQLERAAAMGLSLSDISNQSAEHRHKLDRQWYFNSCCKDGTIGRRLLLDGLQNVNRVFTNAREQLMLKAFRLLVHLWPRETDHGAFDVSAVFPDDSPERGWGTLNSPTVEAISEEDLVLAVGMAFEAAGDIDAEGGAEVVAAAAAPDARASRRRRRDN